MALKLPAINAFRYSEPAADLTYQKVSDVLSLIDAARGHKGPYGPAITLDRLPRVLFRLAKTIIVHQRGIPTLL